MTKFVMMILLLGIIVQLPANELIEYLKTAEQNNPALQAAYGVYQSKLEKSEGAGYLPDPVLSGGFFIAPVESRLGPQNGKFALKQKIPWPGTFSVEERLSASNAEASLYAYYSQRDQLFYRLKKLYYGMHYKQNEIELIKKQLANLATVRRIKETDFESAGGSMTALLFADVKEDELSNRILKLTDDLEVLKIDFNNLLNVDHAADVIISASLPLPPLDFPPFDSLAQVRLNKLAELDSKIAAGDSKVSLKKYKNYPAITLGLEYMVMGDRTDMKVEDSGKDALAAVVSLNLPLYRGRTNAQVKEAEKEKNVLEKKKENELNRLRSEYRKTVYALADGHRRLDLYDQLLVKLTRIIAMEEQNLYSNKGEMEKIINLYDRIYSYQLKGIRARTDLAVSHAYLSYLTSSSNKTEEQE